MRVGRMMTGCRMGAGLALALLLAGCYTTYRYSYEPSVQGEAKTQGKYYLRKCRVFLNGKELPEDQMTKTACNCGHCICELWGFTRESLDRIQSTRPDVFAAGGTPVDIVVNVDFEREESFAVNLTCFGALFTLGIIPGWSRIDREDRIRLLVGEDKSESEFAMSEEGSHCSSSSGLNRLFPYAHRTDVRFTREGAGSGKDSLDAKSACKIEAYAYAIAATLAQMERDGKLSGMTQRQSPQEKTEPKDKDPAASGRLLELRQLYEASVISEEEYSREVKKLDGAAK